LYSTLTGSTVSTTSSFINSAVIQSTLHISSALYSTLTGSTLSTTSSFINSAVIHSTLHISSALYSTLTGSTVSTTSSFINSAVIHSTLHISSALYSTLTGSTVSVSTLSAAFVNVASIPLMISTPAANIGGPGIGVISSSLNININGIAYKIALYPG
jgi:hypothetical protein